MALPNVCRLAPLLWLAATARAAEFCCGEPPCTDVKNTPKFCGAFKTKRECFRGRVGIRPCIWTKKEDGGFACMKGKSLSACPDELKALWSPPPPPPLASSPPLASPPPPPLYSPPASSLSVRGLGMRASRPTPAAEAPAAPKPKPKAATGGAACEAWCAISKKCTNRAKCGGCAWCGAAASVARPPPVEAPPAAEAASAPAAETPAAPAADPAPTMRARGVSARAAAAAAAASRAADAAFRRPLTPEQRFGGALRRWGAANFPEAYESLARANLSISNPSTLHALLPSRESVHAGVLNATAIGARRWQELRARVGSSPAPEVAAAGAAAMRYAKPIGAKAHAALAAGLAAAAAELRARFSDHPEVADTLAAPATADALVVVVALLLLCCGCRCLARCCCPKKRRRPRDTYMVYSPLLKKFDAAEDDSEFDSDVEVVRNL